MLVVLLATLDQTIVSIALPTTTGDLGVLTPLYGQLGDLYGRKNMLQAGIAIFLIGPGLSGMAQSMLRLVIFRAIQGLGDGLIVTATAIAAEVVPPRERGRYQGICSAVFGFASLAGRCSAASSSTICPGAGSSTSKFDLDWSRWQSLGACSAPSAISTAYFTEDEPR